MFTKAKNPDRVFVGLVQQWDETKDTDCIEKYCELMGAAVAGQDQAADRRRAQACPHFEQVRIHRVSHLLARGPTFGRHLQSYLLRDEEFCMQTDSHMDYIDHWDQEVLAAWGAAHNEYAVLATYVNRFEDLESGRALHPRFQVPHICQLEYVGGAYMGAKGMLPRNKRAKGAINLTRPKLTPFWAAGFSFLKCHGEKQTPNDPQLPGIFDGEEYSKGARLWTRGYDIYTPHKALIFHDYNKPKDYDAMSWGRPNKDFNRAKLRLFTLLEMLGGENTTEAISALGRYGLGDRRSLDQYIKFSGNDIRHRRALENRCGTLDWVPFPEHPLGPEGPLLEDLLQWGAPHAAQWPTSISRRQLESYFTPEELQALAPRAADYPAWPHRRPGGGGPPAGSGVAGGGGGARAGDEEGDFLHRIPPRLHHMREELNQELLQLEAKAAEEIDILSRSTVTLSFDGATLMLSCTLVILLCCLVIFCVVVRGHQEPEHDQNHYGPRKRHDGYRD